MEMMAKIIHHEIKGHCSIDKDLAIGCKIDSRSHSKM